MDINRLKMNINRLKREINELRPLMDKPNTPKRFYKYFESVLKKPFNFIRWGEKEINDTYADYMKGERNIKPLLDFPIREGYVEELDRFTNELKKSERNIELLLDFIIMEELDRFTNELKESERNGYDVYKFEDNDYMFEEILDEFDE